MVTTLDHTILKIAVLESELRNLRMSCVISNESNKAALSSLNLLLHKATATAELSVSASSQSVIAAKQVLLCADHPESEIVRELAEEAVRVAERAVEVASETASSVVVVLKAAAAAVSHQADPQTIQASVIASSAVIRAAEVAAEVSRLAQAATLVVKTAISPPRWTAQQSD